VGVQEEENNWVQEEFGENCVVRSFVSFYSWLNIRTWKSQMVRISELVARVGEKRIFMQGFGGKTGRKEYFGRCGLRWEGNIKSNI
jgi:hypothetical protein